MRHVIEREDGTRKVSISFPQDEEKSRNRTKPEFYKDANINYIMKKYKKTGILGDPLNYRVGSYGDFSSGEDYFDMARKVADVRNIFAELPAHIRARFAHEPQNLINFLTNEANNEEAYKMGLKVRPVAPAAQGVPAVTPAVTVQPPVTPAAPAAPAVTPSTLPPT